MISSRNALALALFAGIALAGCGKKQETATATSAPPPPTSAPSSQAAVTTSSAAPAPAPQPVAAGVVASTDGEVAGTRIDIMELKRTSGGTLNLKFAIVNNSEKTLNVHSAYLGDNSISKDSYRDVSGIHLIDPVNKKKYFVITDAEKRCVCSTDIQDISAGSRASVWAKFPAPPPEVQKVTIEIPHFQPIDDVQIQ